MQLGIGSYAYYWATGAPGYPPPQPMTAHEVVARAHAMDVHVVQLADNLPLHTLTDESLDALEATARSLEMTIEVGTRGIEPDLLRTYLGYAQRFGSSIVRTVVDTADHHPSVAEIIETLTPLAAEFEAANIALAIENHDRFKVATLVEIIERIGSDYVGICLDTVNSFGALEGPAVVVETLAPYTVNLHVKDFHIERAGHLMGFVLEGRPAGQGMLNLPWLLEQLAPHGRDPNAILELWPPPEADLDATIAKEDAWVAASVAYLRELLPD